MKRPRSSLASLMAVVALVAIDLAALNANLPRIPDPALVVMVVILEFGLFRVVRRRGRQRAFWIGFEVGGWAWAVPNLIWRREIWLVYRDLFIKYVFEGPMTTQGQMWFLFFGAGLIQLLLGLGVALVGGWLARFVAASWIVPHAIENPPCPDPSPSP